MPGPQIGDAAPNVAVFDTEGKTVHLAEYWRDQPLVLAFLRHFG